jgi:hypothetical protein
MVNIIDLTDNAQIGAQPQLRRNSDVVSVDINPHDINQLASIYNNVKFKEAAIRKQQAIDAAILKQKELLEQQWAAQQEAASQSTAVPEVVNVNQPQAAHESQISQNPIMQNKALGRDSSLLYVLDNRIVMEQVGYRDKTNPYIWLHPRDISDPKRESDLREKLMPLVSMPFPSLHDTEVRKPFVNALKEILPKDPTLSDVPPPQTNVVKSSPFNSPLSHIINGQNAGKAPSEAEKQVLLEANAIYMMLEYKFSSKHNIARGAGGYPDLMQDTVERLNRRGVAEPSVDQLMHELKDALGITTTQFVRTASEYGMEGIAELLKVEKPLFNEIKQLLSHIKQDNFPLNDVINWEYGRTISTPNSDIAQVIENGKTARIDDMITSYRDKIVQYGTVPDQPSNEMLVANALDLAPPLLRELFFQVGGQIIVTQEPDLYNIIGQAATGYNLSYNDFEDPNKAFNQIFISGDLGLDRTNRTIVHEIHHMLFPSHITPEVAVQADILLSRDEVRLHILKELADEYSKALVAGDIVKQNEVMQTLNSKEYAVGGKTMGEMISDVPIPVFLSAVNEAYQYLQIESPAYNRIGAYQDPLDRWREIIPRYAEMRFVQHLDKPELLDFIAPNLTEMYDKIYTTHLQDRLSFVKERQEIKADGIINQNINNLENSFGINLLERNNQPWNEQLFDGEVIIRHPAGDNNPVSLAGFGTAHPSVQNYPIKSTLQQDAQGNSLEKPITLIHTELAEMQGLDMYKPTVIVQR